MYKWNKKDIFFFIVESKFIFYLDILYRILFFFVVRLRKCFLLKGNFRLL